MSVLAPGWLAEAIAQAGEAVARMPRWKRERFEAAVRAINRPDPCLAPRHCDEAQTCVGGCGLERGRP